jgi:hypothetical protein
MISQNKHSNQNKNKKAMKAHVAQFVEPPSALPQNVKYYLNFEWPLRYTLRGIESGLTEAQLESNLQTLYYKAKCVTDLEKQN